MLSQALHLSTQKDYRTVKVKNVGRQHPMYDDDVKRGDEYELAMINKGNVFKLPLFFKITLIHIHLLF